MAIQIPFYEESDGERRQPVFEPIHVAAKLRNLPGFVSLLF
jgi:hypothetical protein